VGFLLDIAEFLDILDREHFLLECKILEENRKTQMVKLYEALEEARVHGL
jgi:hypothetical protein